MAIQTEIMISFYVTALMAKGGKGKLPKMLDAKNIRIPFAKVLCLLKDEVTPIGKSIKV